jgi:iron-sulfur cluster assembly accessory protein
MDIALPPAVTDRALARLAEIAALEGAPRILRVAVLGGGCSGFQYQLELEDAANPEDLVIRDRVAIDPESLPFLAGSVIDFKDELIGARFAIDNPNATASCGCGTSFSI